MMHWKKIAGVLLLIVSVLLFISVVFNVFSFFKEFISYSGMVAYDVSYLAGRGVTLIVLLVLTVFAWRTGFKWMKNI